MRTRLGGTRLFLRLPLPLRDQCRFVAAGMKAIPPGADIPVTIGVTKPVVRLVWPANDSVGLVALGVLQMLAPEYAAPGAKYGALSEQIPLLSVRWRRSLSDGRKQDLTIRLRGRDDPVHKRQVSCRSQELGLIIRPAQRMTTC